MQGVLRAAREFILSAVIGGLLVILPLYLAVLLLIKGMQSVVGLLRPVTALLPDWLPAQNTLSLVVVLLLCFVVGVAVRRPRGRAIRERLQVVLFSRLPGYALFRSLTQQITGQSADKAWRPALVELEDALVPAFVIEEHDDGRFTVFVPSVPTPLAGAVYVLTAERVHVVDVPFTQAVRSVSQWGSGSKDLVAAMTTAPVQK